MGKRIYRKKVQSVDVEWDQDTGCCAYNDIPVVIMWLHSTYKGLMESMRQMVGEERLLLALQKEGRDSIEDDWHIISQYDSFERGVEQLAKLAARGGWGRNVLAEVDYQNHTATFRAYNSIEGRYQKELGRCLGSGLVAGKFAGWCEKVFHVNCWPKQTKFFANGDEYDEFYISPSNKTIESELNNFLQSDNATRADMAVAIKRLSDEVASRKAAEQEVFNMAFYDDLTGLTNRRYLYEKLEEIAATTQANHLFGALLLIDVDYFKVINDSLGHNVGDSALQSVAKKIQAIVSLYDDVILTRLGGDEFVILLLPEESNSAQAQKKSCQIAEKINNEFKQSFDLDGIEYFLTCSIGICLFTDNKFDGVECLKHADIALYKSKSAGRNQFSLFTEDMQLAADQRLYLLNELKIAINENQFVLHYQPIFNNQNKLTTCEALVRWDHPESRLINASEFIEHIEGSSLIIALDEIVFRMACQTLKKWVRSGLVNDLDHLSINISPFHFMQPSFVPFIKETIAQEGVDAGKIMFEVTEHAMLSDIELTQGIMQSLIDIGIRFSIDDYGTGYSSLSYLHRLPFCELKIDRSFTSSLLTEGKNRKVIKSILSLANSLGVNAVAEGIEQLDQLDFLKENQCALFQGYYFSHPLNEEEFEEYFHSISA